MTPGQILYFDMDVLDSKGKVNEENADLLRRYKAEGYFIEVLTRDKEGAKWLDSNYLTPFIDVIRQVPQGQSLYQGIGDKTGVLITKYDKDIREWFSQSIKVGEGT